MTTISNCKQRNQIAHRKEGIEQFVYMIIVVFLMICFFVNMSKLMPQQGHYRYKDGNVDGTDICYEYIIPE